MDEKSCRSCRYNDLPEESKQCSECFPFLIHYKKQINIPKWVDCNKCHAIMCFSCAVKVPESPYINFGNKGIPCEFNKNDLCHALVCYSNRLCTAKDKNGHPKYTYDKK